MSTAPIELDFFSTDNRSASRFAPQRRTCVRDRHLLGIRDRTELAGADSSSSVTDDGGGRCEEDEFPVSASTMRSRFEVSMTDDLFRWLICVSPYEMGTSNVNGKGLLDWI
ncbi:hypothetical protein QJS10_CPA16g00855 [Acorus calamus]|uniref:Uncharacterized protein n=1 Tax=Acorus calamus TaxID=4465 RepID=A0AAV9D2E8_ACOCL|nr:hypothetical protein QJS10_CPA16g00855 [Acorus calamus]